MNLKEALCAIPDVKAVLIILDGADSHLLASSADAQYDIGFEDSRKEHRFVVDGKVSRLAKIMPTDTEITVKAGKIRLDAGRGVYQYHLLPHDQFPLISDAGKWATIPLNAADLKKAITFVQHAAAHQDVRFYMNGVHRRIAGKRCDCVATDGSALAVKSVDLTEAVSDDYRVTLSNKCIAEIIKLLGGSNVNLEIGTTDQGRYLVRILSDGIRYTAVPFDTNYPEYGAVVEAHAARSYASFSAAPLIDAIQRIDFAVGAAGAVNLTLGNNQLTITSATDEGKDGCEKVVAIPNPDCNGTHEAGVRMQLMDFAVRAAAALSEVVAIGWIDAEHAYTFSPANAEAKALQERWIVMPYRL
ncbi:MAG: hypothetical protein WAO76_17730 [Georgfuchsia sp.]